MSGKGQSYDGGGGDVRVRGSVYQVLEKYLQLARDAGISGDRVAVENFLQHAEHYYRVIAAANEGQRPRVGGRDISVADVNVQNVNQGLSGALYSGSQPQSGAVGEAATSGEGNGQGDAEGNDDRFDNAQAQQRHQRDQSRREGGDPAARSQRSMQSNGQPHRMGNNPNADGDQPEYPDEMRQGQQSQGQQSNGNANRSARPEGQPPQAARGEDTQRGHYQRGRRRHPSGPGMGNRDEASPGTGSGDDAGSGQSVPPRNPVREPSE